MGCDLAGFKIHKIIIDANRSNTGFKKVYFAESCCLRCNPGGGQQLRAGFMQVIWGEMGS